MSSWDTVLGQRTMEAIQKIADKQIELRDYIAVQLLQANIQLLTKDSAKYLAELAYSYADVMLEARKKK